MSHSGNYKFFHAIRPWNAPPKRQEGEAYDHQCDPQEVIDVCLNCPIPDGCRPKSSECPLSGYDYERKKRSPDQNGEIESEVLKMLKAGWSDHRIRQTMHIGQYRLKSIKERLKMGGG